MKKFLLGFLIAIFCFYISFEVFGLTDYFKYKMERIFNMVLRDTPDNQGAWYVWQEPVRSDKAHSLSLIDIDSATWRLIVSTTTAYSSFEWTIQNNSSQYLVWYSTASLTPGLTTYWEILPYGSISSQDYGNPVYVKCPDGNTTQEIDLWLRKR